MASDVLIKKGGSARFVIENFVDHDFVTIPAGFRLESIVIKKSGTTAGTIEVGTTDGGAEVVASVALSTVNGNVSALTLISTLFAVETKLYLDVSSAATGTIAFQLQKLF